MLKATYYALVSCLFVHTYVYILEQLTVAVFSRLQFTAWPEILAENLMGNLAV